ncbi:hypothetical protein CPB83DRAFT_769882 [Crepidotus variabilis]|uniref:Uncharacterized protein n=1 Tax=Crepidotus variabilis TaxID=179855 RepID=A0A9P6ECR4_9AGAR|nr:hypothetical protein CPB83DRAFT_769882 [Crepidotus variabilis]
MQLEHPSCLSRLPSYGSLLRSNEVTSQSPEIEPPRYSTQPTLNEETVAYTPRHSESRGPDSSFIKQWSQATLILKHQEEDQRLPTYGRNSIIEGELGLKNPDRVTSVSIKLFGQMASTAVDSECLSFGLCSNQKIVWKREDGDSQIQRCPSILPISLRFPSSYAWGGKEYRMPPSFEATFLGVPALIVRVQYTLYVTITRTRSWKPSWIASKTYVTLVNYRPRTRPARPIVMLETVVSSIKPHPEEWTQIITKMDVRSEFANAKSIECHIFIPSVQTFAINDSVPFHIQLIGTLTSLRELLPPTSPQLLLPGEQRIQRRASVDHRKTPSIRVFIERQVVVEANNRRKFKSFTVGQGDMWPVPPLPSAITQGSSRNDENPDTEYSVDWQGKLKCWDEVRAGGFAVSHLCVKDFLHLSLTPPNPRSSFLAPLQLSHPIRFVTDPWIDNAVAHPSDR